MGKYTSIPVEVEALQIVGGMTLSQVHEWAGDEEVCKAPKILMNDGGGLTCKTETGVASLALIGDYIAREGKGFVAVPKAEFEKKWKAAE